MGIDYAEVIAQIDVVLRDVSDGVTIQARDGHLVYANRAGAITCGFPDPESLLKGDLRAYYERMEMADENGRILAPSDLPGRRALAGEEPEPLLVRARDRVSGKTVWSLLRATAVKDENGDIQMVVNIWHDVTKEQRERKRERCLALVAERLSASLDYEATLATLAEALVPELGDWAAVELVTDGKRTQVALAHVDPEKLESARRVHEKYPDTKNPNGAVATVLRTGKSLLVQEISAERLAASAHDEEHLRLLQNVGLRSTMVVPIVAGLHVAGVLALVSAESGHIYDEVDLALAEEVGRRAGVAIENARIHRTSQEAIRARDEFLAVAGHELRTPLAAVVLQLESLNIALKNGAFHREPGRYEGRVEKAVSQTHRLALLVDELLDMTRVTAGSLEVRRETCDLVRLIRDVVDRFEIDAERSGSALLLDLPAHCKGHWDCQRIEQVIGNLVGNALKYGAGRPIEILCRCEGDRAIFEVIDHGIGVPDAHRVRIFGRFERAVSERNYGGLGLGLWIVRRVVEAHGGTISLADTEGGGSTFTVSLPTS